MFTYAHTEKCIQFAHGGTVEVLCNGEFTNKTASTSITVLLLLPQLFFPLDKHS